jgi:DNA-binding transcriptional ArsR family regulator
MRKVLLTANALSDESRLRMLLALKHGELCVCQLAELVGLAQSTVSKHMYILRMAGLVESRREGRWVLYRRSDRDLSTVAEEAMSWIDRSCDKDAQVLTDRKKTVEIVQSGVCPLMEGVSIQELAAETD